MTPQEISAHKMKWAPGISVPTHSDVDWMCKHWCRKHLQRHQWAMDSWTGAYEHTFRFEHKNDASRFKDWYDNI